MKEERKEYLDEAKMLNKGITASIALSQKKESDWAILGGIADGIAGPAAGIAAAADAQAKNAEIRRHNQENLSALEPALAYGKREADKLKSKAARIDTIISETETKLVQDIENEKFEDLFEISDESYSISETGTIKISVKIKSKEKQMVYGDINAVIDGSIKADIYSNNSIIGTVFLTLPVNGIDDLKWISLEGMDLYK